VRRQLEHRLVRAEIASSAMDWADWQPANRRNELRTRVNVCKFIRNMLLAMGLDPALAISLQRGEEAAAELAAIPDSIELQRADEAITRSHVGDRTNDVGARSGKGSDLNATIERYVASFRNGKQPDFSDASLIELFAFCIAKGAVPAGLANLSPIQPLSICSITHAQFESIWRRVAIPQPLSTD
jgi:hypothetical protein